MTDKTPTIPPDLHAFALMIRDAFPKARLLHWEGVDGRGQGKDLADKSNQPHSQNQAGKIGA